MKKELCNLNVYINGRYSFFINQKILCSYSARIKKMINKEKKRNGRRNSKNITEIKITDFPGGPNGFEMISRFCYNNGKFPLSPSNVCILYSSSLLLEMRNLLAQAETFLDGLFYWTWNDILTSLKSCESFLYIAESSNLLQKLIASLVSKISQNSEMHVDANEHVKLQSFTKEWWFDDLTILRPKIIEKILTTLGAYGNDNKNLVLTRFLLHYLQKVNKRWKLKCSNLADTAVYGVASLSNTSEAFSCRGLFRVLRVVSNMLHSKECVHMIQRTIALVLDEATLDDLMILGSNNDEGVYDVGLVVTLIRAFVVEVGPKKSVKQLNKIGRLMDMFLIEISPDPKLQVSKFLEVAECLPDSARDCFDGVNRALEMYLESHPALSSEDRTKLCRCLNYTKLTQVANKDLTNNSRIPAAAAIQAIVSQQSKLLRKTTLSSSSSSNSLDSAETPNRNAFSCGALLRSSSELFEEKEELRLKLENMQSRVVELEMVCVELVSQMSKMAAISSSGNQKIGKDI